MVQLLQHSVHSHHVEGQGYIYAIVEPYHYHSGASYHSGANNHSSSDSGSNYHSSSNYHYHYQHSHGKAKVRGTV